MLHPFHWGAQKNRDASRDDVVVVSLRGGKVTSLQVGKNGKCLDRSKSSKYSWLIIEVTDMI